MEDDALRLDRQVCFPLYAASNMLTRLYRPVLAEMGLTYPQYLVMLVLWEEGPRSVGALGERLHLDSGTLTPLLKRMEAAGFVHRTRDVADERRVVISLTDTGTGLRAQAQHIPERLATGLGLSPEDVDEIRGMVQGLVETLMAPGREADEDSNDLA